jgi:inner membrane transporter RhtA
MAPLLVLGSCVSLQFGAALAALLFPVAGSTGTTLLRLGLAALLLLLIVRPRVGGWDRAQWRSAVLFGLTLAAMNGSFYASIARIPLGAAVTIEFLGPLTLAAVLSRRPRDLGWVGLAGIGVALFGLGDTGGSLDPVGVLWALVAGLFWACYILASRRVGALVPGHAGLAVAMTVGAVALLPLGAGGAVHALDTPGHLALAAGTGVLASLLPYSLELIALRRISPAVFGVLLSLEPAVAAGAGWLLLDQGIGPAAGLAIGLVVAASAGSTPAGQRPRAVKIDPAGGRPMPVRTRKLSGQL